MMIMHEITFVCFIFFICKISAEHICDCSNSNAFVTNSPIGSIHVLNMRNSQLNGNIDFLEIVNINNDDCVYRLIEKTSTIDNQLSDFTSEMILGEMNSCLSATDLIDVYLSSKKCCSMSPMTKIIQNIRFDSSSDNVLYLDFQHNTLDPTISVRTTRGKLVEDKSNQENLRELATNCPPNYYDISGTSVCVPKMSIWASGLDGKFDLQGSVYDDFAPSSKFSIVYTIDDVATGERLIADEVEQETTVRPKNTYFKDLLPQRQYALTWYVKVDHLDSNIIYVEKRIFNSQAIQVEVAAVSSSDVSLKISPALHRPSAGALWRLHYVFTDVAKTSALMSKVTPNFASGDVPIVSMSGTAKVFSKMKPGTQFEFDWELRHLLESTVLKGGTVKFSTSCSCLPSSYNDAPLNGKVSQSFGKIYFEFDSNSVCGQGIGFTRQLVGSSEAPVVFTSDYMFYGKASCGVRFSPKDDHIDDVEASNLIVGKTYRYGLRSVGMEYQGQSLYLDHKVEWEADIRALVLSGNKPAEGVTGYLNCYHENLLLYTTLSISNGDGLISFHFNWDKPANFEMSCSLKFSKTTTTADANYFDHKFVCGDGRVDCTDSEMKLIVHAFDRIEFIVTDMSTVPISGEVIVANTKFDYNGVPWGGEGCPLENVKVCLIDKSFGAQNEEIECVTTASDGTYTLAAVHGSRVFVNASFNGHSLQILPLSGSGFINDPVKGFLVDFEKTYTGFNFEDTSEVDFELTLAGGLCDRELGEATFSAAIPGCKWGGIKLQQSSLKRKHNAVAQVLQVSLDSVKDRPLIKLPPQVINLTRSVEEETATPGLRYQYNGVSRLRVEFTHNRNTDCETIHNPPSSVNSDGLFVLNFQTSMLAIIYIEQDFENGIVCDNIDPSSTQILVHNHLGLLDNDESDDEYKAILESIYPASILSLLTHCNKGCLKNITRDYEPLTKHYSKSRVELPLMTGRPNILPPYTKTLTVSTNELESVTYVAEAVVVGQYKGTGESVVSLPTYEPLLIIRDPPGGGSSAYYKNVESHIRLESKDHKIYHSDEASELVAMGVNANVKTCGGFGMKICSTVADTTDWAGFKKNDLMNHLDVLNQFAHQGGLTTTWSYTTSTNPNFVGKLSDIFVIPNLNVKYMDTSVVKWNATTCSASKTEEVTYSLQAKDNIPVMSFISAYEIERVEIPSLTKLIEQTRASLEKCVDSECDLLTAKVQQLEDGLKGWRDALALNEEAKKEAKTGGTLVRPNQWFDEMAKKTFSEKDISENGMRMSHNTGLLSDTLIAGAHIRERYKLDATDDIRNVNTIKFSGGGSSIEYQLNRKALNQKMKLLGREVDNRDTSSGDKVVISGSATISVVHLKTEYKHGWDTKTSSSYTRTDDVSDETSIGFTLSDPNIGDVFDVDVFIDPIFGTFVFHTRAGRSMCPHESGTVRSADPYLEIATRPATAVLANDKITFQLKVGNKGKQASPFVLNYENRNVTFGGLSFYRALPVTYDLIQPGETVMLTLSITRGPKLFVYPPVVVKLQVGCDAGLDVDLDASDEGVTRDFRTLANGVDSNGNPALIFAQPCPKIEFVGRMHREHSFAVTSMRNSDGTIEVSIRNPESDSMKMFQAKRDGVLSSIQLQYRQVGSKSWSVGVHKENNGFRSIDFASEGLETPYGIMSVNWEAGQLIDGDYEMRVVAQCPKIYSAPPEYESFSTKIIPGVVDRQPLTLFGNPKPRKKLPWGQAVVIEFNKPLDCYKPYPFSVDVAVEAEQIHYDKSNLLIVCEDRTISIQFDKNSASAEKLIGHSISLVVSNVLDANGNLYDGTISYSAEIIAPSSEEPRPRRLSSSPLRDSAAHLQDPAVPLDLNDFNDRMQQVVSDLNFQEIDILKEINTNLIELEVIHAREKRILWVATGVAVFLATTFALFRTRKF